MGKKLAKQKCRKSNNPVYIILRFIRYPLRQLILIIPRRQVRIHNKLQIWKLSLDKNFLHSISNISLRVPTQGNKLNFIIILLTSLLKESSKNQTIAANQQNSVAHSQQTLGENSSEHIVAPNNKGLTFLIIWVYNL